MSTKEWKEENADKMRQYRREWYYRNKDYAKEKSREARKKARQDLKEWFYNYKKTLKCLICGEKESVCLDFHHIDPSTKEFSVAAAYMSKTKERLLKEISKCVVLCANCHRKVHAGIVKLPYVGGRVVEGTSLQN